MKGGIEGGPRGEPTSQPLQGRAEGRESLQGPTTVDRSERLQPQKEGPFTRKRSSEKLHAVYETDGNLFATRAIEALDELLEARIPDAQRVEKSEHQKVNVQLRALRKATSEEERQEQKFKFDLILYSRLRSEGYMHGLEDAFRVLYEHITGESTPSRPLMEEEPESGLKE